MWPFRAKGPLMWLVEDCENAYACTGWVKLGHKYLANLQSSLLLIRMLGNNPLADKDATFNLQWWAKVSKVIMGFGFQSKKCGKNFSCLSEKGLFSWVEIKETFLKNLEYGKSRKYSWRGKLLRQRLFVSPPVQPNLGSILLNFGKCNLQV